MHLVDGKYECAVCGAALDVPDGELPLVEVHAGSRIVRVLRIKGIEVHRCDVGP